MWSRIAPSFEHDHRVVLYDLAGSGRLGAAGYDEKRYGTLAGHAEDLRAICHALKLTRVVFVGHSVSAMVGALAAIEEPELFRSLVMVGPSPRYLDDADYVGGFSREDIDGLLENLESNYFNWSHTMAPVIMGNTERPELGSELARTFCKMDPDVATHFARVTFLSDNRADLSRVKTPTLVMQCSQDVIAPNVVGEYVSRQIPNSRFVQLRARGHCPHVSAPEETTEVIRAFLR